MLFHLGLADEASKIQNAWLKTIEDGIHTPDIYNEVTSKQLVGTKGFAQAVVANLGQNPSQLQSITHLQRML